MTFREPCFVRVLIYTSAEALARNEMPFIRYTLNYSDSGQRSAFATRAAAALRDGQCVVTYSVEQ